MHWLLLSICATCAIINQAWAQGRFIQPSGSDGANTFAIGDTINITWTGTSSYPILSLGVYSSSNVTISWLISDSRTRPSSYRWTVNPEELGFDLSASQLFTFYACNGTYSERTGFTLPFRSALFNIKNANTSVSSTSTTSTASTTSSSPTGSSTTPATSTLSSTGTAQSDSSSTLSVGAKVGIAIAATISVLAIIVVTVLLYRRRKGYGRQQTSTTQYGIPAPTVMYTEAKANDYYSSPTFFKSSRHAPIIHEVAADSAQRAQLPTREHYSVELPGSSPLAK